MVVLILRMTIKCINFLNFFLSDINECIDNTHNCRKDNALCNNTEGSFNCTCKPGYTGDGYNCTGTHILPTNRTCLGYHEYL